MQLLQKLVRLLKVIRLLLIDFADASKHQKANPKTLLIVKTDAIGDYILFRNFLKNIRESARYKEYKITLCGNEIWKDLCIYLDTAFVDDYIWINRKKLVQQTAYRKNILAQIANSGFQEVVNPIRSRYLEIDDAIVAAACAPVRIARSGDLSNIPRLLHHLSKKIYNEVYEETTSEIFEFSTNKFFIEKWLNIKIAEELPEIDYKTATKGNNIIIVPGSGEKIKQWLPQNFAKVCEHLDKLGKYRIIIIGATDDAGIANEIITKSGIINIENLCGKTTLPQMMEIIANAQMVISNDTGAVHIAAAMKVSTICLINGIHFGRFGPYPAVAKWVQFVYPPPIQKNIDKLYGKYVSEFKYSTPYNVSMIEVDEVMKLVVDTLQES